MPSIKAPLKATYEQLDASDVIQNRIPNIKEEYLRVDEPAFEALSVEVVPKKSKSDKLHWVQQAMVGLSAEKDAISEIMCRKKKAREYDSDRA